MSHACQQEEAFLVNRRAGSGYAAVCTDGTLGPSLRGARTAPSTPSTETATFTSRLVEPLRAESDPHRHADCSIAIAIAVHRRQRVARDGGGGAQSRNREGSRCCFLPVVPGVAAGDLMMAGQTHIAGSRRCSSLASLTASVRGTHAHAPQEHGPRPRPDTEGCGWPRRTAYRHCSCPVAIWPNANPRRGQTGTQSECRWPPLTTSVGHGGIRAVGCRPCGQGAVRLLRSQRRAGQCVLVRQRTAT